MNLLDRDRVSTALSRLAIATLWLLCAACTRAQATYTADRAGELQFGGSLVLARANYLPIDVGTDAAPLSDLTRKVNLLGGGAYGSFDMAHHIGIGLEFRRLSARNDTSAQTSAELQARYTIVRTMRFAPFLQAGFGRGWYRYPQGVATLGYNVYGLGGGLDYHLSNTFNVRASYEYQSWLGVPIRNPQPQSVSIGFGYRFH